MSDSSHSEKRNEKPDSYDNHAEIAVSEIDTGAQLAAESVEAVDPAEALRIRRTENRQKYLANDVLVQFMDKTTLAYAAILGIEQEAHLTVDQYNWLGTIFYLSYLVFEYPQNLALQRFPVGKWMSINIFVWSVALCSHAACKSFGGLFVARFVLGICEGSITAGFMIVSSMFYTRTEQTLRVGYWFLMNGTAQIILAFVAYGTLHITNSKLEPWQWLMIITGLLTLILSVCFWLFFPDSPTNAWFLTPKERVIAIQRIKGNQTGVENKHFKKEQLIELLWEPKTWLFFIFSVADNIPNSLTNQGTLIITSFGFTTLQTTLLGCVAGVIEIVTIWSGVVISARIPNSRAFVASAYFLPSLLGIFLLNLLPWIFIVSVISLAWVSATTAGHTKKVTMNAVMLCGYCIGNALGPFMWQEKYKPRNHVPWITIGCCFVVSIILLMIIRINLAAENRRRDAEPSDTRYDNVYVELMRDGSIEKVKVEKEFLDLTDTQNREFRYVL
ncbi:major facilitator superfamily domain-containing protein [Rhodocollybia butyracea]|uniref:Major facilitator superfamily domain-containing protein n=1 Tax=Rhodocollybia butyracea TaxID=206335 RepID=A0A9P5QAP5_9AGAR|nr:major facilitator superfamily domain-containing protein [Rhodocollybia butyracea]